MGTIVQSQLEAGATGTATTSAAHHPLSSRRVQLAVAAGVACVAAAGTFALASGGRAPAHVDTSPRPVPAAYAPGGSVYDEQVPALARRTAPLPVPRAYAPGGSVYDEQVPVRPR